MSRLELPLYRYRMHMTNSTKNKKEMAKHLKKLKNIIYNNEIFENRE